MGVQRRRVVQGSAHPCAGGGCEPGDLQLRADDVRIGVCLDEGRLEGNGVGQAGCGWCGLVTLAAELRKGMRGGTRPSRCGLEKQA